MPTRMEKRQERRRLFKKDAVRWGIEILAVVLVSLLVRRYVFSLTTVQGPSMMDTLMDGQVVAVDKTFFKLHEPMRGHVVICRYSGSEEYYVKRIVGLPGDEICAEAGITYVNGEPVVEAYVEYTDDKDFGPVTVEEGCVFVMGDNRANSHDSRAEGAIPQDMIVGRVVAVCFPLGDAHFLSAD